MNPQLVLTAEISRLLFYAENKNKRPRRTIAENCSITRSCISLFECFALNLPPLIMEINPNPSAPRVATIATIIRIGSKEDITEIWYASLLRAIFQFAWVKSSLCLFFLCDARCRKTVFLEEPIPLMSFLDHISRCNEHDLSKFVPLIVEETIVGQIRRDNVQHLESFKSVFKFSPDNVRLADGLRNYADRTEAIDSVINSLFDQNIINRPRNEAYPVGAQWGGPYMFQLERSAASFFGVRAYGIHVNGFVRVNGRLKLWVAVRAKDRLICPGQLDNMIAGGQPVTLTLRENLLKEANEEANVAPELATKAISTGAISYVMEDDIGLKPDIMFCWDLELPLDFEPVNMDGEIADFYLMPIEDVMEVVDTTFDFKFNCNLVNIDFFIRHGVLSPEHRDYVSIVRGLRS